MQIIPTILESSSQDIINQITRLSPYFDTFQIDIIDGIFAPNKTPSVAELLDTIKQNLKQTGFQLLTNNLIFDFHLMTEDFEKEIDRIGALSKYIHIRNILVHIDLSPNYRLLMNTFPNFSFGPVINSEDNVYEVMESYDINTFPFIQFMTVHIGSQGNPFIAQVLKKIEQLKRAGYRGKIFLDGSVNEETLALIMTKTYRPDVLCIGSYLTRSTDLENRVSKLQSCIKNASIQTRE
ncbi:hypothetical protein A2446_00130 [Candidatus Roizmanbacteria bacterium RIFOXYC2_FULL_38_9]|uniref:Ribulose-phosphate 3-epimerase n=1 Tax=Candidatus Roizmanbacteria bacterium RIFOXYD1_FULL_38_12 TaxID=1802093 RepID=A0A1F7L1W2_9BACT|nr:MAG: hypothetical protein A3K47_05035 [Candidatus Roizmanbacteria bacterium RIFOXYA2_FULL_38_14]OGK64114.1 MAG: hypothetical protein A3K27_05035 [Candidatus Roizmanbacteria bacterium RIFOXYA1_FULL_37_12]OGK65960.1 MAG: hypothetical protein A3K38_05035 [Candidatus Roizmanbacteria bacterium RIFOXYB1_FULL_40_23]OGK70365.1 MAG: hypothetical protein A3K21_05040 [Candidatus Roizmanbacteria bacterium RIFOXYC1_FULL_38_14]OGK74107.1 MAG: hypothetical protein A3K52_05035 [Candidatus Roizmanbacteria ba